MLIRQIYGIDSKICYKPCYRYEDDGKVCCFLYLTHDTLSLPFYYVVIKILSCVFLNEIKLRLLTTHLFSLTNKFNIVYCARLLKLN